MPICFTSEADKECHKRLIHSGTRLGEKSEPTLQSKKSKVDVICPICGEIYPTRYSTKRKRIIN